MPFTSMTDPDVGDPTKKSFAQDVIANLNWLNSQVSSVVGDKVVVPNGSFERDGDADDVPDGWLVSLFTGGAFTPTGSGLSDTACGQGRRAVKFTHPGGGGNGGATLTSENFFEVNPLKLLLVGWEWYSSVTTMSNKVDIKWYDEDQAFISTTNLLTQTASNPAAWDLRLIGTTPPPTARFAKLVFTGGDNSSSTAGSMYLDNVSVTDIGVYAHIVEFEGNGTSAVTHSWRCPPGINLIKVTLFGGGAGGGGGAAQGGGGGGGSGEVSISYLYVTPGTDYAISIGGGGVGGIASTVGGNGGDTTWAGTGLVAKGGTGGVAGTVTNAAGGAGGTGGTGDKLIAGNVGRTAAASASGSAGGYGGDAVNGAGGGKAATGAAGLAPTGSKQRGAGGGGGSQSVTGGAAGAPGSIIIEW